MSRAALTYEFKLRRINADLAKAYPPDGETRAWWERLSHGGQQYVRVEHVYVNDGGQAVIGNVKQPENSRQVFSTRSSSAAPNS